jgi:HK97 family phage major capsid protein
MPTVASNALTVAVGDFQRAYWIVDRIEIQTLRDPFSRPRAARSSCTRASASAARSSCPRPSSS